MEVNMPDETETSLSKGKETRKEKTTDKKTNYASLQDMRKIISKSMEKDERKVKENNTKRSVLSKPNWSNEMWNKILEEGEDNKFDNVNLI